MLIRSGRIHVTPSQARCWGIGRQPRKYGSRLLGCPERARIYTSEILKDLIKLVTDDDALDVSKCKVIMTAISRMTAHEQLRFRRLCTFLAHFDLVMQTKPIGIRDGEVAQEHPVVTRLGSTHGGHTLDASLVRIF